MKIRYLVSMGGVDPRQANEKSKNGNFVYYDVSDYEAVRLIDAEIAMAQNATDYKTAKENYDKIVQQRQEAKEILEAKENLEALKIELDSKKVAYKSLADDIKYLQEIIKRAED